MARSRGPARQNIGGHEWAEGDRRRNVRNLRNPQAAMAPKQMSNSDDGSGTGLAGPPTNEPVAMSSDCAATWKSVDPSGASNVISFSSVSVIMNALRLRRLE